MQTKITGKRKMARENPTMDHVRTTQCRSTETEPGLRVTHGSPGQRFWLGRVGSQVSVSDPVFDPVLSFNMCDCVYLGAV